MDLKQRERLLLVAVVICLGAWIGDKLVLSPLVKLWKQRSQKIVEVKRSLDKGHTLLARESSLREQWKEMKRLSLPAEVSVAEYRVLESQSRWSQQSRLSVTSLKPRWTQDEPDHKKMDCRAATQGRIEAVTRFLYELERDPLALRVEEIKMAARDDSGRDLTLDVRYTGLLLTGEKQ
jgi:hypothetical protein